MTRQPSGRLCQPVLSAIARPVAAAAGRDSGGSDPGSSDPGSAGSNMLELASPAVGLWRGAPVPGTMLRPGDSIGELEILGVLHALIAPAGVCGLVLESSRRGAARQPVGYGDRLLIVDPRASGPEASSGGSGALAAGSPGRDASGASGSADAARAGRLVFRSPMSGRYYSRPGPDKPPFVSVGDEIRTGTTICLLEAMKTFNRISYGGSGLPESARILAIVACDEDELAAGDIILELE